MAEVIHDADGDHTHIPVTDARQGRWGRHVLWVLLASTLLAALVLFAAWGMRSGDLSDAQKTQDDEEDHGSLCHRRFPRMTVVAGRRAPSCTQSAARASWEGPSRGHRVVSHLSINRAASCSDSTTAAAAARTSGRG